MYGKAQILVNPFKQGETITIPSGSDYISMAPNVDGIQKTKQNQKVVVDRAQQGYTYDEQLHEPQVIVEGENGYWEYFYLNEVIVSMNGHAVEYKEHTIVL
ncbi:MAG: hypothetical protein H9W81_13485 [Enterococcus sp.]|nr:hypothetical protein [Enterococcus sp.]